MNPLASALIRTGLAVKINQVKRATESYARDRVAQSQSTMVSYGVAAGLYAAAGIFAIALLLVGVAALFRWVQLRYGLFEAFGASAGVLLVLAVICAAMAAARLQRKDRPIVSLGSRLRVAISANPAKIPLTEDARDPVGNARAAAARPYAPVGFQPSTRPTAMQPSTAAKAGLVAAAALMGWALARRRSLGNRPQAKAEA